MAFSEAGFGGSIGGQFRLRLQCDLITQEIGNNRSLIRVSAWFTRVSGGSRAWNFYTTSGNVNVDGGNYGRSIGGYDFNPGVGNNYFLMNSQDFWIGHDGAGNRSVYVGASYNAGNGPYITTASTSFTMGLPNIPRYAAITGFSVTNVTDEAFTTNVNVSDTCNFLQYSLNGGGWQDQYGGNFGGHSFTLSNLRSDTDYSIRVRVRRADSGLWTESGTIGLRTLQQNSFFFNSEM
jgi:hypothetical protein